MGFLALYANEKFFRDGHVKRQTTMTNLCFEGEKVLRLLNLSLDIITIRKPKQSKFRKICEAPSTSKFEVFLSTSSCQDRYRVKKISSQKFENNLTHSDLDIFFQHQINQMPQS